MEREVRTERLMKTCHLIAALSIVFALVFPLSANALGMEAAAVGWLQAPSGTLGYKALSSNDILDLDSNLNYEEELRPLGRLKIDMPVFIPNIYVMYTPMEFEGNGVKSGMFKFGNQTFNGSAGFSSQLTLDNADFALYYGIPGLETATLNTLNVDVGINLRLYDVEAQIAQEPNVHETASFLAPIPMLYLASQFRPIDELALEVEGRGISIGDDSAYSLIGRLRWNAIGPLFLSGGYRYDKVDIEEDDLTVDTDFSGPFIEVGVAF